MAHIPAVTQRNIANDCESETGSAIVSCPCIVNTAEPLEDTLSRVGGNAGPVVSDSEAYEAVGLGEGDGDRGCGMADCVVQQVAHDAPELTRVTSEMGGGDAGGGDCGGGGDC